MDMCERLESLSSLANKLAEEEQNSLEVQQLIKHLLLANHHVEVYCFSSHHRHMARLLASLVRSLLVP